MIKCESTSICVVAVTTGREGGVILVQEILV